MGYEIKYEEIILILKILLLLEEQVVTNNKKEEGEDTITKYKELIDILEECQKIYEEL